MNNLFIVGDSIFFSLLNNNININDLKYFDIKICLYDLTENEAKKKINEAKKNLMS